MIDILQDDSLFCRIYIEESGKWIDGILLYFSLERNVADIFVSSRHFKSLLPEGSKLIVKSLDSEHEYIFTGTVSKKVVSIRKQSININIDEMVKSENSRLSERFNVNHPVILKKVSTSTPVSGILMDISSGGIMISSPNSFDPNTALNVEIFMSTDRPIYFVGRVLRKSSIHMGYHYGIVIEEIDNENAVQLNRLIEFLVSEKKGILDEFRLFRKYNIAIYTIFILALVVIMITLYRS